MTGEVRGRPPALGAAPAGGFEIPMSAILSTDGTTSAVWIIDEASGTVARKEVTLGAMTPRGVLVGGLEPGQWIATAGVHYLRDGQQVRIMDASADEPSGEDAS
jgi:multidrug efflux pump subunit AcrA (membrane-fusion protein)